MNRKILTVAVGAAVLASAANANQLLFPYFRHHETVYTLFSLVNTHTSAGQYSKPFENFETGAVSIHVAYNYKSNEGQATESCKHYDSVASMSTNDMAYFDVTNRLDLPTAYNDRTKIQGAVLKLADATEATGYALMSTTSTDHNLYGQAIVLNTTNGLAYAYNAYSASMTQGEGNISNSGASWVTSNNLVASWYPAENSALAMDTQWYVLPLTDKMVNSGAQDQGSVFIEALNGDFYNHDEVPTSGNDNITINCLGIFGVKDIANSNKATGGWAQVSITDKPKGNLVPSIVYKIESTELGGQNFIWAAPENRMAK